MRNFNCFLLGLLLALLLNASAFADFESFKKLYYNGDEDTSFPKSEPSSPPPTPHFDRIRGTYIYIDNDSHGSHGSHGYSYGDSIIRYDRQGSQSYPHPDGIMRNKWGEAFD